MPRRTKAEIMDGVEHESSKVVDHNTVRYEREDGTVVIRLHLTDIVEFLPDGRIKLNSGGWQTVTTKDRMDKSLNGEYDTGYDPYDGTVFWGVCSEKGIWYLWKRNANRNKYTGKWEAFQDGMVFDPKTGEVEGGGNERELEEDREVVLEFARYIKRQDEIPLPSNGDCWYCSMFPEDSNSSHLFEHAREKYLHGSLVLRAMRDTGYRDAGIAMLTGWGGHKPRDFDDVARSVKRYILKKTGMVA